MNDATATAVVDDAPANDSTDVQFQDLCGGERVTLKEAEAALVELGEGWRLETPHEAFSAIDYGHKNANGALSRDESRTPDPYWTNQQYPLDPAGRVVVWFGDGDVGYGNGGSRARARAVRVAGQ